MWWKEGLKEGGEVFEGAREAAGRVGGLLHTFL